MKKIVNEKAGHNFDATAMDLSARRDTGDFQSLNS